MSNCPCGNTQQYDECCGRYISGQFTAPTAEALMRSRYTAYVLAEISYLEQTLHPDSRKDFDPVNAEKWAKNSSWLGLEIIEIVGGKENDTEGTVEFIARYSDGQGTVNHHEISSFRKEENRWYFVDGRMSNQPYRREVPKIGRNSPCPCGSGKKYKKCCGSL